MPHHSIPLVGEFLGRVSHFVGLRKSADAEDPSQESHAAETEAMGEAAERAGGGAVNKRGRGTEEQDALAKKKLRRTSDDDYRLLGIGGGKAPKDSHKIAVPSNSEPSSDFMDQAARPQPNRTYSMKPTLAGGYKPKNTLDKPLVGRAGQSNAASARNGAKTQPKAPNHPFKVPLSQPGHAVGDGFKNEHPKMKKSKQNKNGEKSKPTDVVNLVDDEPTNEIEAGEVLAVNKKSLNLSSDSQQSLVEIGSQPPGNKDWFAPTEAKHVAEWTDCRPPKRRRRASNGQKTPSLESRAQPGSSSHDDRKSSGKHHDHDIEDLAKPSKRPRQTNLDLPKPKGSREEPPEINLTKGFESEGVEQRKGDREVTKLNGLVSKNFSKKSTAVNGEHVKSTFAQSESTRSSQQQSEDRLSSKFHREAPAPEQHNTGHQRATQRMQEKSNSAHSGPTEDSPDQLQGRTTVSSRSHLTRNPERYTAKERERSPSDLPPTKFTSRKSSASSVAHSIQRPEIEDDSRIPLSAIYSRGCVLDVKGGQKKIDLVWHEQEQHYVVECDEIPYLIPGKNEIMSIGESETHSMHGSKDSLQLVLKGSVSARSNGFLILCFANEDARGTCFAYLLEASKNKMKTDWNHDRLEKIFRNQKHLVQQDAMKVQNILLATSNSAPSSSRTQRIDKKSTEGVAEEKIIFEQSGDEQGRSASTGSKMQTKSIPPADSATSSKYFDEQPRRSTRQSKPVKEPSPEPEIPERWTVINQPKPWNQSVMYPDQGPRKVTVDFQDLERLDEGEFLNDNLISYAMRRIEEKMAPEHRKKVHFFNSFFMAALSRKYGRPGFNYDAVKKWTKQKDLFDVPYVVVPINENLHWYVAIICNLPNLVRKPVTVGDVEFDAAATPPQSAQGSRQISPIRDPVIPDSQEPDASDKPEVERMGKLSIYDRDSREGDGKVTGKASASQPEEQSPRPSLAKSGKKSNKRGPPPPKKYPVDKPAVVTLDSMGTTHPQHVSYLKQYVQAEAEEKRGMTVEREDIQGMKVIGIPQQPNFCDCGLFLIGYLEEFAKDPQAFVTKVLNRQLDSDRDFASFDASKMRDELRDDLLRLHKEQEEERLAAKKAKRVEREKVAASGGSAPQSSAAPTPASDAQRSPAQSQAPTARTSKASSPAKAPSSKKSASWAPHESLRQQSEPGPGEVPAEDETRLPQASQSGRRDDASEDEELESAVPRPLLQGNLEGAPRKREKAGPNAVKDSAGADPEDGDGDMLDDPNVGHDAQGEAIQSPPASFHKVKSPELDPLSLIFQQGPAGLSGTPREKFASAGRSL